MKNKSWLDKCKCGYPIPKAEKHLGCPKCQSTTKHTPGPWKYENGQFIKDSVDGCDGFVFKPTEADKVLMATAPELLEALYEILDKADPKEIEFIAQSAIAKAESKA